MAGERRPIHAVRPEEVGAEFSGSSAPRVRPVQVFGSGILAKGNPVLRSLGFKQSARGLAGSAASIIPLRRLAPLVVLLCGATSVVARTPQSDADAVPPPVSEAQSSIALPVAPGEGFQIDVDATPGASTFVIVSDATPETGADPTATVSLETELESAIAIPIASDAAGLATFACVVPPQLTADVLAASHLRIRIVTVDPTGAVAMTDPIALKSAAPVSGASDASDAAPPPPPTVDSSETPLGAASDAASAMAAKSTNVGSNDIADPSADDDSGIQDATSSPGGSPASGNNQSGPTGSGPKPGSGGTNAGSIVRAPSGAQFHFLVRLFGSHDQPVPIQGSGH